MHRDVRRIGHQIAFHAEDGATEVEAFLDVHRIGRVLKRHAHLLGDRHEEVVEYLEHHRVGLGADLGLARPRFDAAQNDVVERRHLRRPPGLDDRGCVGIDDDGGPIDAGAGGHGVTVVDLGLALGAIHVGLDLGEGGGRRAAGLGGELGVLHLRRAADDLGGDLLDDVPLLGRDEPVLQVVGRLELRHHVGARGIRHLEG